MGAQEYDHDAICAHMAIHAVILSRVKNNPKHGISHFLMEILCIFVFAN